MGHRTTCSSTTFAPWSGRNLKLNGALLSGNFLLSPSSQHWGQQEEHTNMLHWMCSRVNLWPWCTTEIAAEMMGSLQPCLLPSAALRLHVPKSRSHPTPWKDKWEAISQLGCPTPWGSSWQHFDGTWLLQAESNKINLQEIQERWFPSMELPHLLKLAGAQCTHCVSCQPAFRQLLRAGQGIDLLHRTKSLSSPSIS